MIITLSQAKALLQITNVTYDTVIQSLIPIVQDDIVRYCNTAFQDRYIFSEGTALATVRGDPDTITDSESNWVNYGFLGGMDVYIEGGAGTNMGVYQVGSVAAGTLTLTSVNRLIDQDIDDTSAQMFSSLRVSRIHWPVGIELPAASMVWYQVKNVKQDGVKSERIDDYAVTYGDSRAAYPDTILQGLNKYRFASIV
ncbi:hypothetical protein LCGC14_2959400 [marine sediment metagenome]|uniref:Uncharacterized protein n=1 Tax=marine sediment metagenome TaxID=412755 RepID=A0A0F8ZKI6_9ZZZZ